MKNLKKVLALAVAFVMCFTMFAGAAVYSDVPAGSDYSEAVTLLSDLGVIAGLPDGSFGVNQTITRADAACLIARMLTGETMPSKYAGASNFTDVRKDAYYESAVAYCAIMGITSGTSTTLGTYSPEREITDGEFIAMITRALGYDTPSNPLSFPMGNVARAQQEGILDNVNVVVDSPALRGEDAQMIYNALFADYDAYSKQQNIYMGADDQVEYTIAHEVFSLDRLAVDTNNDVLYKDDIETTKGDRCVAHTWVVVGVDPRDDVNTYTAFPIKDKTDDILGIDLRGEKDQAVTFVYDGDAESILGYQVELWGDDDHTGTEHDIVAVKTVKGQTAYDWNISMGEDGADELTVADGKTVDAEDATLGLPNTIDKDEKDLLAGVHIDPANDVDAYVAVPFEDKDDAWKNKDGDSYRLFDWDSDGDIEFALKTTRKYAEVTDIDSQDISFKCILDGKEFSVDREIGGDQLTFDCGDIEEDDVIEMTYSRAYSAKEKGEVVSVKVEKVSSDVKELTKVSTKGALQMTFDGDVYEYASDDYTWDLVDYGDDYKLTEADLDANYELWLDANGYIVKLEETDDNSGYLVVLEMDNGEKVLSKSRSSRASMKVKLDDNTVDVYDVAFDLQIVGTKAVDLDDSTSAYKDVQTIVWDATGSTGRIDKDKIKTKVNLNTNKEFYDKDLYRWTNQKGMVGQVYKYWMDSDKVITKLERVAETVDYYEQYYDDTGVVRVAGGVVYDGTSIDWTKRTYLGREFNGNVYLKNAKVLFITDAGAVGRNDYKRTNNHIAIDPDDVLAIEPTTANLRKIDIAVGAINNLADTSSPNYSGSLYHGNNTVGNGARIGGPQDRVKATITKSAQIAYDIDNNNYATAAIMKISNFADFDKSVTVGLITDVEAVNRKDTIFTVEGAIAGKVGAFTTVEADDGASEIFSYWTYDSTNGWHAEPYDNLSDVRDDIDDNAVYAEITQDADGKITKVVVMDYEKNGYGALYGPNKMVVRVVIGNKDVVDNATVSFASHANDYTTFSDGKSTSGSNIMVYAAKDKLYEMSNISWHNSFDLTGSTSFYQITDSLKEVIGMKAGQMLQAQYGSGRRPNAGFTDQPTIKEMSDYTGITTSRTSEMSNVDKYAVADVAFNRLNTMLANGQFFDALNGADAIAVFSYAKRFGAADVEEVLPTITVEEAIDGVVKGAGTKQVSKIAFTNATDYVAVGSDLKLTVTAGKQLSHVTEVSAGETVITIVDRMANELEEAWKDVFDVTVNAAGTEITLTAKEAADNQAVKVNGRTSGTVVAGISLNVTETAGAAKVDDDIPASITLKFTGYANVTSVSSIAFKVDNASGSAAISWIGFGLSENGDGEGMALATEVTANAISGISSAWDVELDGDEVTFTQKTTSALTWADDPVYVSFS